MSSEEPIYDFWCPSYSYRRDKDYTICQMCLPAGNRFLDDGFEFCDRPPTNGECGCCGPRGECCLNCYICLSPLGFAVDFLSLPFRSVLLMVNCCRKKPQEEQEL